MNSSFDTDHDFDVVIIGGALSGASTALLLLREQPRMRVLIVEKSTVFGRRVGEATVEVSTYFLCRRLGLTRYLNDAHLTKNGLRFWFSNEQTEQLDQCSEIGGRYLARVPAYLVDRAALDEEVLRRAVALGAVLWRPATVQTVKLEEGATQQVSVRLKDELRELKTRWVVDASGVAAFLARQQGWWKANAEHPTTAVWSRWRGVRDFDDVELAAKFPKWAMQCYGIRGTATNHLMGDGWWAWWIPLKGGDVSIGVTYDQRLVTFPEEGSVGQRLKEFLVRHPVARELLAEATWTEGDVHWRKNLPYYSTRMFGDGFALVGDAAAFLDPFYSPGMDWISFTTSTTVHLLASAFKKEDMRAEIARQDKLFVQSYDRWFRAIYKDKYEYFGEYDLMRLAFLLDLGFYYFGVARQPFTRGEIALREPLFSTKPSIPFYHFMRFYNRRLARIARHRREQKRSGRFNAGRRFMFGGFTFEKNSAIPLLKAVAGWILLELREGWRSWWQAEPGVNPPKPVAATNPM